VLQLSLLAVRKRYRYLGIGSYIIEVNTCTNCFYKPSCICSALIVVNNSVYQYYCVIIECKLINMA